MAVPNIFGTATAAIPLSQLDTNFATAITLGNTAVYLGNTTTSLGNVTLTNVTISSGNVTVSNITANAVTSPTATNLTLQSAGTTAVTIDTSQNVGIGTASPAGKLDITSGTARMYFSNQSATAFFTAVNTANSAYAPMAINGSELILKTGDAERARIDSSGNLLVGSTSQLGTSIASFYGGGTGVISMRNTASTAGRYWKSGPDSGGSYLVYNDANTGMYMLYGGTSWTSSSDERTKTTLVPFENALEKVCSLRAGTGRYLKDEETVSRSFLIAQDVQKVLPEAVNAQDDEIGTLGLQYTDVIPLLVAAIKEQQALIQSLTTRITALEAK
jgi:hypothetical protein